MSEDLDDTAENRTELAEDRTLLANERTFGGWVRTAMAAIGVGVGFHVLFQKIEPSWIPKSISTIFILMAIYLIVLAEKRAGQVKERLNSHSVEPLESLNLRVVLYGVIIGGVSLILTIWFLV